MTEDGRLLLWLVGFMVVTGALGVLLIGVAAYRLGSRALDGWLLSLDQLSTGVRSLEASTAQRIDHLHHSLTSQIESIRGSLGETRAAVNNLHVAWASDGAAPDLSDPEPELPPTAVPHGRVASGSGFRTG